MMQQDAYAEIAKYNVPVAMHLHQPIRHVWLAKSQGVDILLTNALHMVAHTQYAYASTAAA